MGWRETLPGRFERPFDTSELFYKSIADGFAAISPQREHWAVTVCAHFDVRPSIGEVEPALRHAWKTMRHDHPQIASFAEGNTMVYEVPSAVALELWLANTFFVKHDTTADGLLASPHLHPLPTIHYLPQVSQIIVRLSHWRIDGIGALLLLKNFFAALAEPRKIEFGTEGRNLSASLDEVAEFSPESSEGDEMAATELYTQYANNLPSMSLPLITTKYVPGATRRLELQLQPGATSAVLDSCKSRRLTITTALHAALISSLKQVAPTEDMSRNYTSWVTFNLRPYLPAPFNTEAHAVTLYSMGIPLTLEPSNFTRQIAQLQCSYSQLSLSQSTAKVPTFLGAYVRKVSDLYKKSSLPETSMPAPPVLISLGDLDHHMNCRYGNAITLNEVSLATEVLTRQLTLYVWSWKGRMSFSICYNEEFYTAAFVTEFLQRIAIILFDELSLDHDEAFEKVV